MAIELSTIQDVRSQPLCQLALTERALRTGLPHIRRSRFPSAISDLAHLSALGEVLISERTGFGAGVLLEAEDGVLVALSVGRGQAELAVAGRDAAEVDELAERLAAGLRDAAAADEEISVTFWAGGGSPINVRRRLSAPAWDDIAVNYPDGTRDALSPLMLAREPGDGGLLLWHGAPGTGKSYALRALARAWQDWCDTWFIADPEVFLGQQSSYLLQSLLRADRDHRHRLLILEDAGELLAADARVQAGQALSRLLNLTDGLLGAGLGVTVLVTTNEPLRKLHPAVARPGRCWAEVSFLAHEPEAATRWLAERGTVRPVDRPTTLAELFAIAAGRTPAAVPRAPGFAV